MKKYAVTFDFKHGSVTVEVMADDQQSAIVVARCKEAGPPVPDFIPASAIEIKHGGIRSGSGNRKRRKLVDEPRTIKKQIRWTEKEWQQVVVAAEAAGIDVADYQRKMILKNAVERINNE